MKAYLQLIAGQLHDTAELCTDNKTTERIIRILKNIEKLINDGPTSNAASKKRVVS
jgi:hypothetical protein